MERTLETLASGFCGRLATIGADGYPYSVPLLYVWMDGEIYLHNTSAKGHLRTNVDHEARVCFEMDEPSEVFPYGRFECDTSVAFRSVIVFGKIRVVNDLDTKQRFFEALMREICQARCRQTRRFLPAHRSGDALRGQRGAHDGKRDAAARRGGTMARARPHKIAECTAVALVAKSAAIRDNNRNTIE